MKVTASGNGPASDRATSPSPFWSVPGVVVTVNEPGCPAVKVALSADVIVGATTTVTDCNALVAEPTLFVAFTRYPKPVVPAGGVPETAPEVGSTPSHDGAPEARV